MINTKKHLAYVLKINIKEMDFILQNIPAFYYEKKRNKTDAEGNIKYNADGSPETRQIYPSKKRLKIIQKRIKKNILDKIQLPDYIFGGVKGKDNIKNAKFHQGKKFKLTTDLKNYFPSISHKRVYETFIKYHFSPTVSRILTQLTTFNNCIPQGTPTASSLANLVFLKTGDKLSEFSLLNNLHFSAYIDDLTFSSKIDFKDKVETILKIVQNDFKINHKKTSYSHLPIVTGLHPMNNYLKLPDAFFRKLLPENIKTIEQKRGLLNYKSQVIKSNNNILK